MRDLEQFWFLLVGVAGLLFFTFLSFVVIWLALLSGLYNPDPDCEVPTFDYPDCSNALMHVGEVAPPLTSEEWIELRHKFHTAMTKAAGEGATFSLASDWMEPNTFGFYDMSALEIRFTPGLGRALFAKKPIPKGTKIWDSRYRAVFPNVCVAKIFFANQTNQQKCDAMFWGYINNFYGNGIQYMFDLDGHGYINHSPTPNAVHHFEGELDKNEYYVSRLRFPSLGIFPLSQEDWERRNRPGAYGLYAAQDIPAGEEILYNYEEIFMYGWLDWFTIFIERSLPISEWLTI